MTALTDRWPYSVPNPFGYGTCDYLDMCAWLRKTMGNPGQAYTWQYSDLLLFATQEDAIFFSLSWNIVQPVEQQGPKDQEHVL
jgi:hypothetical protein